MSAELYTPSEWGARYHALIVDEALGAGSAGPGKTAVLVADPLEQIQVEHTRCTKRFDPANPVMMKWARLVPQHREDELALKQERAPVIISLDGTTLRDLAQWWEEDCYHEPGASVGWALHLRRLNVMLDHTIVRMRRLYSRVDPKLGWDAEHSTFIFPHSGFRLQCGHCKDPGDWERYYSNEYTALYFDELNQFLENQYDQIITRVRSSDWIMRKLKRVRSMSNPTLKHDGQDFAVNDPNWVRRRFIEPYMDRGLYPWCGRENPQTGKKGTILKRTLTLESGKKVEHTWIYLPAWLRDNPDIQFRDAYEATLRAAKPHIRRALLDGDWYSTASGFYADAWIENLHVCPPFSIPNDWPIFRSMDWGFKAPGCIHWAALDPDGTLYVFREFNFKGKSAKEVAKRVRDIELDEGLWKKGRSVCHGPADTQLWEQRGEEGLSKAEEFAREGVHWHPADKKSRRRNAERLLARMNDHKDGSTTPGIVFFSTCKQTIRTLPAIPTSSTDTEEPMKGGDDHPHDSICYLVAYVSRREQWVREEDEDKDDEDEPTVQNTSRDGYGSAL